MEIIDRDGLPGLSMRGLGSHLHVEGMTLYRYFPEKEAILDQVVEVVLDGIGLPHSDRGWSADMRDAAIGLRDRLLLHPNAMPLVASRWSRIPVLRSLEHVAMEELMAAGFDETSARTVMSALMSLVLGHSWIGVEGYVGELPDSGGLTRKSVAPLVPGDTDAEEGARRLDFERGLDLLLEGAGAPDQRGAVPTRS